jgi:hypothetical protein
VARWSGSRNNKSIKGFFGCARKQPAFFVGPVMLCLFNFSRPKPITSKSSRLCHHIFVGPVAAQPAILSDTASGFSARSLRRVFLEGWLEIVLPEDREAFRPFSQKHSTIPTAKMPIAAPPCPVAVTVRHRPRVLVSGGTKTPYKRSLALLRRPAFANFWCSVAPCLSTECQEAVESIHPVRFATRKIHIKLS